MIVTNVYKNLCRSRLLSCSGSLSSFSSLRNERSTDQGDLTRSRKTDKGFFTRSKNYSTETQTNSSVLLPSLSDYPPTLWPKLFDSLRNFYRINMVIKSRLDPEFREIEFMKATKQALYVVSRALANEDYERLEGLVIPETIEALKERISRLSDQQKQLITVEEDDVYLSFPQSVEIIDKDQERKFVEIMVVHHSMRGLGRLNRLGEIAPLNDLEKNQDRVFVANYRFFREYARGVDSSWTLNIVNHFSPATVVNFVDPRRKNRLGLAKTTNGRLTFTSPTPTDRLRSI